MVQIVDIYWSVIGKELMHLSMFCSRVGEYATVGDLIFKLAPRVRPLTV